MGYVAGSVKVAGVPTFGVLARAYRLDDGTLGEEASTDSTGLFVMSTLTTGDLYTVVAHDLAGGTNYNAIVYDSVAAVATLNRSLLAVPAESQRLGAHEISFVDHESYEVLRLNYETDFTNSAGGGTPVGATTVFGNRWGFPNDDLVPVAELPADAVISLTGATELIVGTGDFTFETMFTVSSGTYSAGSPVLLFTLADSVTTDGFQVYVDFDNSTISIFRSIGPYVDTFLCQPYLDTVLRVAMTRNNTTTLEGVQLFLEGELLGSVADTTDFQCDELYFGPDAYSFYTLAGLQSPDTSIAQTRLLVGLDKYQGAAYTPRAWL